MGKRETHPDFINGSSLQTQRIFESLFLAADSHGASYLHLRWRFIQHFPADGQRRSHGLQFPNLLPFLENLLPDNFKGLRLIVEHERWGSDNELNLKLKHFLKKFKKNF